ncbi:MAG: hypothetical protein N2378_17380 [Chloroflexaceae bacterium]|nr:hypothetical protein [Chloroflexaceae bacterium]
MSDQHPTFEELVDLVTGHQRRSAGLTAHLRDCEHCQKELQSIRQLIAMLQDTVNVEVPRAVLKKINGLLRQRSAPPPRQGAFLATLLFDSLRQTALAGVRSVADTTRQLLFDIDGCKLDLRIRTHLGRQQISGQFLGYSGPPPALRLQSDSDTVTATINELLVFDFPPVSDGHNKLLITFDNRGEVEINLETYTR